MFGPLVHDALRESRHWVPTPSRRVSAAVTSPPPSLAKRLGPSTAPRSLPIPHPIKALTLRSAPQRRELRKAPVVGSPRANYAPRSTLAAPIEARNLVTHSVTSQRIPRLAKRGTA